LWTWPFVVCTDPYSLKYLLNQCLSTIPQHAWVSKLFGYQFAMEFKPDLQNAAVDALSHYNEEPISVHSLSLPEFELMDQFRQESLSLPEIAAKRAKIEAGKADKAWAIVDGIVVHDGHVFLPSSSALWPVVVE
jgi:hypothetical protein